MKTTFLLLAVILMCSSLVYAQNTTNTTVQNVTQAPPAPQIECSQSHCDRDCVKCSDRQCHDPEFVCTEEVTLEKFFPNPVPLGVSQLNIVLSNTGNVALDDLYAVVTGDGIETIDWIPLKTLAAGDRDYVFARINATKSGTTDIIIKLYVSGNVKHKFVDQLTVTEPPKVIAPVEQFNVTLLTSTLDQLKQKQKELELEYQTKKQQGYPVDIVYDKLRNAYSEILSTQSALLQSDYKLVQSNLEIIKSNLDDIEDQLNSAKKQEQTLSDTIKSNLLLYGSIAAAIVSIFTAYKLVQSSVDKKKLLELHKRITSRPKKKKSRKK